MDTKQAQASASEGEAAVAATEATATAGRRRRESGVHPLSRPPAKVVDPPPRGRLAWDSAPCPWLPTAPTTNWDRGRIQNLVRGDSSLVNAFCHICLSDCHCDCLSVCLSVFLSGYLSVCLSVCLPFCQTDRQTDRHTDTQTHRQTDTDVKNMVEVGVVLRQIKRVTGFDN